jgi:hypothetical protein
MKTIVVNSIRTLMSGIERQILNLFDKNFCTILKTKMIFVIISAKLAIHSQNWFCHRIRLIFEWPKKTLFISYLKSK